MQILIFILMVGLLLISGVVHYYPQASATNEVLINEVEANPAGTDSGGSEKVELYNPSSSAIDVGGWTLSSAAGRTVTVRIDDGTAVPANSYFIVGRNSQWLDNSGEMVELRDNSGALIDSAGPFSDDDNDDSTWQRSPDASDNWVFASETFGSANFGTFVPNSEPAPSLQSQPKDPIEPESPAVPDSSSSIIGKEPLPETQSSQNLTIVFIDVGQGDSILVILPNGKTLLIDGGERDASDTIISTLQKHSVSQIDAMVATHPHADHIGGLIEVLNSNVTIGEVLDSGQLHTTQTFEDFLDAIDRRQIPLTSVKEGDFINLDSSVRLQVLNPREPLQEEGMEDEINNNSVVIKLEYGNFSALFTGDMEQHNELALVNNATTNEVLNASVLKAGHHGSRFSSTDSFLQAVSPQVVIISSGANNSYGHPHEEALERIVDAGAEHVLRTDLNGTITLTANGSSGSYSIATEKTGGSIVVVPEFEAALLISIISLISVIAYSRLGILATWKIK